MVPYYLVIFKEKIRFYIVLHGDLSSRSLGLVWFMADVCHQNVGAWLHWQNLFGTTSAQTSGRCSHTRGRRTQLPSLCAKSCYGGSIRPDGAPCLHRTPASHPALARIAPQHLERRPCTCTWTTASPWQQHLAYRVHPVPAREPRRHPGSSTRQVVAGRCPPATSRIATFATLDLFFL